MLVHCQAGCSRSVAIVAALPHAHTAYLRHYSRQHDQTTTSRAGPQSRLHAQLELYEQVGFEVDMKWQAVRRFLMSKTDILNGDSMEYASQLLSKPISEPWVECGG